MDELQQQGAIVSKGGLWSPGGKTVATASSRAVIRRITPGFKRMGVLTTATVRHLGIDYGPEGRRRAHRPPAGGGG